MKEIFSFLLLSLLLISQFQIGTVYAQAETQLEKTRESSLQTLESLDTLVNATLEKIEGKTKNLELQEQIQEKQEEIQAYIEEVEKSLQEGESTKDIKTELADARKTLMLKVVSGVTPREDIFENIPEEVQNNKKKSQEAETLLQESLTGEPDIYTVMIRSKLSHLETQELFATFDQEIKLQFLYEDAGKNYFELQVLKDSIMSREIFSEIESGKIPEKFISVEFLLPELYLIGEQTHPAGEDVAATWGIAQYQSYNFFGSGTALSSVRVGVVDTGVDAGHPDLAGNVKGGYDFVNDDTDPADDQGHGTHVAGTIAAKLNGAGILGVNPKAEITPLKICTSSGFCPSYAVLRALEYAKDQKLDILNMSLGGRANPVGHPVCAGISAYSDAGGIVVAAAGNSNVDTSTFVPGGCSDALTVAAVDSTGKRAVFSNYGSKVDVSAPGVDIYSTYPQNKGSYKKLSGTSMAAPHIVGLVSLLRAQNPTITASQAKNLLKKYPQGVQSDAGKDIAQAVLVPALLQEIYTPMVSVAEDNLPKPETLPPPPPPEEKRETPLSSLSGSQVKKLDEAILDTSGVIPESTKRVSFEKKIFDEVPHPSTLAQIVAFGDIADITEIQNDTEGRFETVDISETQEAQKQGITEKPVHAYDAQGKEISGNIEINSDEAMIQVPASERYNPENFLENTFQRETSSENISNTPQTHEVFLFGAEKGVEINSIQEAGEEVRFETQKPEQTSTGTLLNTQIEYIPNYQHQESIILENIEINSTQHDAQENLLQHLSDTSLLGPTPQETLQDVVFSGTGTVLFEKEVFIDGAEKPIEINSLDETEILEPTPITPEIYDPNAAYNVILDPEAVFLPETNILPQDFTEIPEYVPTEVVDGGVIENPEGIEFTDTELQEGEVVLGVINNSTELKESESIGIQNTYSCSIKIGQSCRFYMYALAYTYSVDNPGVAMPYMGSKYIELRPMKPGVATFQLISGGVIYHTIYITVTEPVIKNTLDIQLIKGNTYYVSLPSNMSYSTNYFDTSSVAYMNKEGYGGRIYGNLGGQGIIYAIDAYTGIAEYKINVSVIIPPPVVEDIEIYVGYFARPSNILVRDGTYQISQTNDNVTYIKDQTYGVLQINGQKIGTTKITGVYRGDITHIYNITIKPIPTPQEYNINIAQGKSVNVYFPETHRNKRYTQDSGNTGNAQLLQYPGYVTLQGTSPGTVTYRILDDFGILHYILRVNIIQEPVSVDATYFVDQTYSYPLQNASNYIYSSTNPDVASLQVTSAMLYIKGLKAGATQITASDGSGLRYIFNITVNPAPEPQRLSVQTQELKTTMVALGFAGSFQEQSGSTGKAHTSYANNSLTIAGQVAGNITYHVRDSTNLLRVIIDVTIIPEPPIVTELSVFETRSIKLGDLDSSNTFTFSQGDVVSLSRNGSSVNALGLSGGYVEIYQKDWNGRHTHTYKVTVIPKPSVQTQIIKVHTEDTVDIYFPTSVPYTSIVASGENIMESIQKYPTFYRLELNMAGTYTLSFKDANSFDVAQIIVESAPQRASFQVPKGYKQKVGSSYSSYSAQSLNSAITTFYRDDTGYVVGNEVGNSEIHMYRDGQVRLIFEVQVVPTPAPVEIDCAIYIGETCHLDTYFGSLQFVTDNPQHITMEYGSHTIRVKGQALGNATVYVKGRYSGVHLTHILKVRVIAKPAEIYSCSIPAGAECQTEWYDDADTYTITSSNTSVVNVSLSRYFQSFADGTRKLEKTIVKGMTPGYAEVYLYRYGVHIATIQTTVTAPVDPLMISGGNLTIKEGESKILDIISGGGGYQKLSGDESIADLRISSLSNTGTVKVTGVHYGQEVYVIRDQYFQTDRLYVTVEDTILELSHEVLELKGSNPEYVYARESYKGIKSFTKSNDNIRVTKKLLPDGWEVLEVYPETAGETILKVYDYQDNVDTVTVIVGGSPSTGGETGSGSTGTGATGTGSETSSSEKIRYIRDWANGSDKNGTNYWVEIQALERITGSNVALGKTVTGLRPGTPSYPYTRIVDGDINSSNYAQVSGRNALTNIQVDLGALYDVEKIKIWHYYTDGRIFRETKTEVSADGVNWITLFDSSVSGTYPEPKKGEGRTYEVKKPLSPEEQELEALIQEILGGIGVQNNEEGIAINSYTLTDVQKNKLSEAVKRMTLGKTQEQIDGFNTALKNLEVKYAHNEIIIVMIRYMKNLLKISVIEYIEDISTGNIGGLHFKISQDILGSISNVGVEFINGNGIKEKQELKIQADGEYIVAFSNQSCSGCKNLKPYYLISGNTDTYVASFEDENIVVASSSYEIFRNILTNIWFWKGYDKEYNRAQRKIVDIKEDVRGNSINLILQAIAKTASIQVDTKYINVDTLPVAGYMLNKFLNGPIYDGEKTTTCENKEGNLVKCILWDTDNWISKQFKQSVDYDNILKLLKDNRCNNNDYKDINSLGEGEETFCVVKDGSGFEFYEELDLYMATHAYDFAVSVFRKDGILYTKIIFWDEYDFEPNKYGFSELNGKSFKDALEETLSNSLNYLGNYSEKNLSGTTYWWKVEIINKL